jgi:hypothetical protein
MSKQSGEVSEGKEEVGGKRYRGKKKYGLQIRRYPHIGIIRNQYKEILGWSEWWTVGWYSTERDRDAALEAMKNKTPFIWNGRKMGFRFDDGTYVETQTEYQKIER